MYSLAVLTGQALARAAYARPQLALFDDVLSGLDNHTAKTVFNRLFSERGGLFRVWGTTVILATQTGEWIGNCSSNFQNCF